MIARYGSEIFTAANEAGVYVLLEAAVGGGIPVVQPLKQALGVNRIQAVTGIINGTTNYILTRMQREGGDFESILADAQRLGYAEADPSADVDGLDAADKIAILASLAFGGRIKLSEVYSEGIRHVTAADILYANRLGFVIKLLAIARRHASDASTEELELRVHPTLVPESHPLASVNDVYNAILVEGDPIGQVMFLAPVPEKAPPPAPWCRIFSTLPPPWSQARAQRLRPKPPTRCWPAPISTTAPLAPWPISPVGFICGCWPKISPG